MTHPYKFNNDFYAQMDAYARGVLDGYNEGTCYNMYDGETQPHLHKAYKDGYEWGVAKFCEELLDNTDQPTED